MTMQRLWSRIDQSAGPGECWPWTGAKNNHGYGQIRIDGRLMLTHRVVVNAPAATSVRHTCDNPPCCNPQHLLIGTQRQNVEDAVSKGRMGRPTGAKDKAPRKRQDECKRGHPLSGDNVREWKGHRICKTCQRLRARGEI